MKSGKKTLPRSKGHCDAGCPPSSGAESTPASGGADPPEHRRRKTWFRIAALFSPILLLVLVEVCLRVFGYGYPTGFFLNEKTDGGPVLVQNPRFGWRFFPAAVSRSPEPVRFMAKKPEGSLRIFVLGESAAMGDPDSAYGMARQLQVMLQTRYPGRTIEVINVAMTAINSHVILEIARDCSPREGDFWILYAGNNEVVGPYGAGTVFGRQAPLLSFVRATLGLKATRTGQWLSGVLASGRQPAEWLGMELFLREQVPAADPRLKRVYENFTRNLEAVMELGKRSGAKVLASTVAVNLRDCPPFGSLHRSGLGAADLAAWEKRYAEGREAEAAGRYAEALAAYQEAARSDAEFAELAFRQARCELALGREAEARTHFSQARDLDTLRFRSDSQLNAAVRSAARRTGIMLIDAEAELSSRSPQGLPGDDWFYDHVHFNFTGNYAIALLFAREIEKQITAPASPGSLPDESEVRRRLAFSGFDQRRVGEEMRQRLQQPPFNAQSNFKLRDERWRERLASLDKSRSSDLDQYRQALAAAPDDWVLEAGFAHLLEAAGDPAAAKPHWQHVTTLLPGEADAWFHLANLAYTAQNLAQAESLFRKAIERSPRPIEALNSLGLVKADQGDIKAARRCFADAIRLDPRSSDSRVNIGVVLARTGDTAGAVAEYRTVLRLDTNNVPARVNLARLLAGQRQFDEAIALYQEALRLRPENPIARFNFGNVLAENGRPGDAVVQYEAAVQEQPDFGEARYSLALTLAKLGRIRESLDHFAAAVRLMPASADAHFNYGIALAKEQHLADAAAQFQAALRIQPDHSAARAALERAAPRR